MAGRLDRVQVVTAFRDGVTLTWNERDRLLDELRPLDSLADVSREFENAGASRPIVIPQELKLMVAFVIETIGNDTPSGIVSLGGLFELRNHLRDEFA
jgi:hypothetical protein